MKLANELTVGNQIQFSDFVSDPQALMQICDCIALTSYEETFGLVLPEAMRAGIAVIGSNAGGVPEIIDHEITGLLFEPRNAHSLCRQIDRLHTDRQFKLDIANAGKHKADTIFNQAEHFIKLEKLLFNTVSKRMTTA